MTTAEVAAHLAKAAARFEFLGITDAEQLMEVVRCELGHPNALDDFVPYAGGYAMAVGPAMIVHIISGNTPHAGLQSLIRGLLLGAYNLCKIPGKGAPEMARFVEMLPEELSAKVEIRPQLPDEWIKRADAVIVFGSDETIEVVLAKVEPGTIFVPHGSKVSLGLILDDPRFESVRHAARDASLFDQQGCLSPHGFYVRGDTAGYAEKLAVEMEKFDVLAPRAAISKEEAATIAELRRDFGFRAANDPRAAVYGSKDSTNWTVLLDPDPSFTPSVLNRVIYVKPMPDDLASALAKVRPFLSTIAIWPATIEHARWVKALGASRICAIGKMQAPPFTWHQDGGQTLAPLVRWIDAEVSRS